MERSANYKFTLPDADDIINIKDITKNFEIIDTEMGKQFVPEAVVERVLDGLTEKIKITSLPIVGAYTGWQIYADGNPLSENIIPICESFITAADVVTGLTAGFFQNDKEIVRCKINTFEHEGIKYINFSDYERISEKNEIEYIQKKMVGVHFGRLNSSATGAVTLTDIPDNSLILLASGEGLELNATGQSDTISATAKHLVIWTGSARDHEVYGITGERMTYIVYTQNMSLTNLKPYNVYTAYTKSKTDAVDGDTGISIVCPVHTYIGVIGAEFPK